ncbi:MAG: hypothetical protein DMF85_21425, partial [Acidobacteria bacterium]
MRLDLFFVSLVPSAFRRKRHATSEVTNMRRHARIIAAAIVLGAPMGATARQQDPAKAQSVLAESRAAIGGKKLDSLRSLGLEATVQRNMGNI